MAYAHAISADLKHDRHMTAGVAVVFKRLSGKPTTAHCINSHLAYQNRTSGAGVYSLITKPKYYHKRRQFDYDTAFDQLIVDFKNKNYTHLICSPIGCIQDEIELKCFISNLSKFQLSTRAQLTIGSCHESQRRLRRGLKHDEFQKHMQSLIDCIHRTVTELSAKNEGISPQDGATAQETTSPAWKGWPTPLVLDTRKQLPRPGNDFSTDDQQTLML